MTGQLLLEDKASKKNTDRIRKDVERRGCSVILRSIGRLWRGTEEGHVKAVKIKIYKTMLNQLQCVAVNHGL